MRLATLVRSLLALSSIAASLPAQDRPFAPGARIRYRLASSPERQKATVLELTADSIVVGSPTAPPRRLALASITSIDVGYGRSHLRGAGKGALWGAALGVGYIVSVYAGASGDTTRTLTSLAEWSAVAGLVGVIYGAPIGLLIGSERWDRVPLHPDRVGVRPSPHGVGLALSWTH